jgi:tRNA(fMet)-specific endonuclease VapC
MNAIALDTNIAIDILNGQKQTIALIEGNEIICLPVTVCGELLFGARNSSKQEQNERNYQSFIRKCVILDINFLVADEYSTIRLELKQKGKPIPENDIWIAAVCIVNDIQLVSHDKHFENIDRLRFLKI